jgi:CRP-like cAMP-binding protein
MNLKTAQILIDAYLREQFGKVVELRGVRVTRQASGRQWVGDAYRITQYGEVRVGTVAVDEDGEVSADFSVEQLLSLLSQVQPIHDGEALAGLEPEDDELGLDLTDLLIDEGFDTMVEGHTGPDDVETFFVGLDTPELRRRIRRLVTSGWRGDLLEARELLPMLLPNPEGRGEILHRMAELELLLGDVDVGLTYLEASAREFADRASIDALEFIADRTLQVLGAERFREHPMRRLLEATRARLRPVAALAQVPVFENLGPAVLALVEDSAETITAPRGTVLIKEEGTPVWAFVVSSGVVSIWIEPPAGGARFVRCCFPGEFIGETSVLGGMDASSTATVRVEQDAELWKFSGFQLRALVEELPQLRERIEATAMRHRLDSFFSTGGASAVLDVRVRDRLLSCFGGVRAVAAGETVFAMGSVPDVVYLVVEGGVEYRSPGAGSRPASLSAFIGLRNALHGLAHEGDWVATEPSRLVAFDADKLRELATSAPADVTAVLEALE